MTKKIIILLPIIALMGLSILAQQEVNTAEEDKYIERIEVRGNNRITTDTIIYYIETREGDLFNERTLKNDFQALWNTGFFSNLVIKSKEGLEGKIIIIEVEEQKIVNSVDITGLQKVNASEIFEFADKMEITIKKGTYLDMGKLATMKQIILQALVMNGLKAGMVDQEFKDAGNGRVDVIFKVTEGTSILVEEIRFIGNKALSDWQIRDVMEELGNHNPFSFLSQKDVYNEMKLSKDMQSIRDLYWKLGYLDVLFGDPEMVSLDTTVLFSKNKVPRFNIAIPIDEGKQYRLNNITVEGNKEFDSDMILSALPMKKGDIYNHAKVKDWLEFLKRQYGHRGFVMLSLVDERKKNPDDLSVDLNMKIKENDIYYINRINISGNSSTNDEVIRRQMLINEGDVFDNKLLELSVNRIRQLGYFETEIDINPQVKEESKDVDIALKVQERGSTNINFGVAYSELEGFYGNFSFETKNLFGAGNTFGISGQFGKRTNSFSFNYYDPWFLGQRLGLGASIFVRDWEYPGYIDKRVGGDLSLSYPISPFMSGYITYSYQVVNISFPDVTDEELANYDYYDLYYYYYYSYYSSSAYLQYLYPDGEVKIGSITNSFKIDTVDHPLFPHNGYKGTASLEYGGAILGGNLDFLKGTVEVVGYIDPFPKNVFGFRGTIGWIESLNDTKIPVIERFFLGGDRSLRGLTIRSVGGEYSENGIPTGGTKMALFNFEWQFIVTDEMRLVLFLDAGNAYSEDQDFNLSNLRKTAGVEARLFLPVFNVPMRLIFAFNLDPRYNEKSSDFLFSMGTMF
jgi:outer membrane protein insertion porin family